MVYSTDASPAWDSSGKILQTSTEGLATLGALRPGVSKSKLSGRRLLCTVMLALPASATAAAALSFDVEVKAATDAILQTPLTSSGSKGAVVMQWRGGHENTNRGFVFVVAKAPLGLFVTASSVELVNTAVLDGAAVSASLSFTIVTNRGGGFAPAPPKSLTCASTNTSVLQVNSACTQVRLTGSETAGAAAAAVNTTLGQLSVIQTFAVWHPRTPVVLVLENPTLQRITGWQERNFDGTLRQVYQSTKVFATTTFSTGTAGADFSADVTALVDLATAPSSVAMMTHFAHPGGLVAPRVEGRGVGVATLSAMGKGGVSVGKVVFGINNDAVGVARFYAVAANTFAVSTIEEVRQAACMVGRVCAATVHTPLAYEGDRTQIIAIAEFTDGTVLDLPVTPGSGLALASLDNNSIVIDGVHATVPVGGVTHANGTESPLVHVQWTPGVATSPIMDAEAWLAVKLPPADKVIVQVLVGGKIPATPTPQITRVGDVAAKSCYETELELQVSLIYPATPQHSSGRVQVMTADARTQITVPAGFTLDRAHGKLVLKTGTGTAIGKGMVKVHFTHDAQTATVDYEVLVFKQFAVKANPEPSYPGSLSVNAKVLRMVQHTSPSTYEQAKLSCKIVLSNGDECAALPGVRLELDPVRKGITLDGATVIPGAGTDKTKTTTFDAHCLYGSARTGAADKLAMEVLPCDAGDHTATCAYADTIDAYFLQQGNTRLGTRTALRGKANVSHAASNVALTLRDGRKYVVSAAWHKWLPGLVTFARGTVTKGAVTKGGTHSSAIDKTTGNWAFNHIPFYYAVVLHTNSGLSTTFLFFLRWFLIQIA